MTETREPPGPANESPQTTSGAVGQQTADEPSVRLDWSAADDVPAQQANAVEVQFMGTEMLLTLGVVLPPIAMARMTAQQTAKYLDTHSIPVKQITKVVLSREATWTLVRHLRAVRSPADTEETGS